VEVSSLKNIESLKITVINNIDKQNKELTELSHKIHDNPELGFKEYKAVSWLTAYLKDNGFQIETGIAGLATAFKATYGQGKPHIALIAEYDALPKLGHACGHNIIATSAVGAGIAAKAAVDAFGGSLFVIGCPAEEIFGGKIDMVRASAFDGLDLAMMVHPTVVNTATILALALNNLEVEFFGKPAHAAAYPHKGINALDAMILSFNNINSLRQHIRDDSRIHGIITDGGEAPNIIPAHSAGVFIIRSMDNIYLEELKSKVVNCFKGAATATGARLEYKWEDKMYASMKNNVTLAGLFDKNMSSLGRKMEELTPSFVIGSTDMGNVSQIVPSIHATVSIAPPDIAIHTSEFANAAISEAGTKGLLDAAKGMAMTIVDVLGYQETIKKIKQEFLSS
jgi:amidohydrolase